MDKRIEGVLARIGNDDPRYEAIKQQTHTALCWGFKFTDNGKPMCTATLSENCLPEVSLAEVSLVEVSLRTVLRTRRCVVRLPSADTQPFTPS